MKNKNTRQILIKKAKLLLHIAGNSKACQFQISARLDPGFQAVCSGCSLGLCPSLSLTVLTSPWLLLLTSFLHIVGKMTLAAPTHMLPIYQPPMKEGLKNKSGRKFSRKIIVGSPWVTCLLVTH